MRCSWIREVKRLVRANQLPQSYNRTVANLAMNYFLSGLMKRHLVRLHYGFSPVELLIAITDWCPNRCAYCYNRSGRGEGKATYINLDRLCVVLDEVKSVFGIHFAIITGGEPFPYVLQLAARRPDFTFFVYTSGNIDDQTCVEMVKIGNIIPALTIVDVDPKVHDLVRGEGNFSQIMSARERLRAHNLPWGWSLTSSQINYCQIKTGDLLGRLGAYEPFFIRAMPWMPVGRSDENFVLAPAQMSEVGRKIKGTKMQGVAIFDYITAPVGYPCLAGGKRSFFLAPDGKSGIRTSPCVFMQGEISVPVRFDEGGSSSLLEVLRTHPWFINSRQLAGKHQCIIHENRGNWTELIRRK